MTQDQKPEEAPKATGPDAEDLRREVKLAVGRIDSALDNLRAALTLFEVPNLHIHPAEEGDS